jgi:hypothetical protein
LDGQDTKARGPNPRRWSGPKSVCGQLRDRFVQLRENLAVLGKTTGLVLAVNELAVGLYVEDPAAAPNQLDSNVMLPLDRGRQTGGCRLVISLAAVLDADFHAFAPDFLLGIGSRPFPIS